MIGRDGENNDNGEDIDEVEDDALDEEISPDVMPDIGGDTLVDVSGELKVDELIVKTMPTDPDEIARQREVHKRLEELAEKRNQDLDSTFNIELDDDT